MSNIRTLDLERIAAQFKALSNPHRLRLFARLARCCDEDCCDSEFDLGRCAGVIGNDLGIAPSTVSHHLKELRVAGLVQTERHGRRVLCRIDRAALDALSHALSDHFSPEPTR
jgi:ArsR family transcriptional regulator